MVQCSDCGFLGLRQNRTGRLREAIEDFRKQGSAAGGWNDYPLCAIRAADLDGECATQRPIEQQMRDDEGVDRVQVTIRAQGRETTETHPYDNPRAVTRAAVRYVISRERDCTEFIEWHPGFTPQDHRRMLDQRWREAQEDARRRSERRWRLFEMGMLLLVGAGAAILGGLVERGVIF